MILVFFEGFGDSLIEGLDGGHNVLKLPADELHTEDEAIQDSGLVSYRYGFLDQGQIVEAGSPAQLLRVGTRCRDLFGGQLVDKAA